MTGTSTGTAIVETLESIGVSRVFGIPGYHVLDIYNGLGQSEIRHIMGKNEEGVVRTANGASRVSDEPEVAIISAGPGAVNSMTGVGEAYALSIPLVVIAGAEPKRDGPHGVDDPHALPSMYDELAKGFWYVTDPRDAPAAVVDAYETAHRGRPGPAVVQIPVDVLKRTAPIEIPDSVSTDATLPPEEDEIERLADSFDEADRPAIVIGQGGLRANVAEEVHALAERLDAPVIVTDRGYSGYVRRPRYTGGYSEVLDHPASSAVVDAADTFLGVGVRERIRRFFADDLDAPIHYLLEDLERYELGESAVFGDLRTSITWLTDACDGSERTWWRDPVEEGWTDHERELTEHDDGPVESIETMPESGPNPADRIGGRDTVHPTAIVETLNDLLEDSAIVTGDVGVHLGYTMRYLRPGEPGTFLGPENWGAMGHAVPAAIGANVAAPDRQVVAVVGDGSLLMNLAELSTAVEQDLDLTVVVFDNSQHNAILVDQLDQYGETGFTYVPGLDYAAFAENLGGRGFDVDSPDALRETLGTALETDGVSLVDVPTHPNVQ